MFATYIDEKIIIPAPRCIHVGNKTYVLPTPEQYAEAGYYQVFDRLKEDTKKDIAKFYHYEDRFELKEPNKEYPYKWIDHYFVLVKDEKPHRDDLIVSRIRKQYTLNEELAILRQKDSSSKKAQEFETYFNYCEECKSEADKILEEWEKA